jgi:hypothetical protein
MTVAAAVEMVQMRRRKAIRRDMEGADQQHRSEASQRKDKLTSSLFQNDPHDGNQRSKKNQVDPFCESE